mmetsp:Transcript_28833/g.89267  ORF Transcript_28833/g.89267 Transcript_28833/m.89267 type:complete len:203 (+) Transcript_28833:164-772(+)
MMLRAYHALAYMVGWFVQLHSSLDRHSTSASPPTAAAAAPFPAASPSRVPLGAYRATRSNFAADCARAVAKAPPLVVHVAKQKESHRSCLPFSGPAPYLRQCLQYAVLNTGPFAFFAVRHVPSLAYAGALRQWSCVSRPYVLSGRTVFPAAASVGLAYSWSRKSCAVPASRNRKAVSMTRSAGLSRSLGGASNGYAGRSHSR